MTSYDEVPYPSFSYPQTHPDRLATLATLFGMTPPPVEHCRVLELGCAAGGNLLPMAEALPRSEFVGIDLSARQIAEGQTAVAALGLKNVTLGQANLLDVPDGLGPFDYILAHGLYSWIPAPEQDKLLSIGRRSLAPNGVAYVSYNTYPGWHGRAAIAEMMRFHTRQTADPQGRVAQARTLLDLLAESAPTQRPAYSQLLKEEQERLRGRLDPFLLHDQLSEVNEAVYFHEFMERAMRHGLQYLAEAEISTMMPQRLGPDVAATLARMGGDLLGREQYLDFVTNRPFRQTLLCHQDVSLSRELSSEALGALLIAAAARSVSAAPDLRPGRPEEFRSPAGNTLGTDHALTKAALIHLAEIWPRCLTFDALQTAARARLAAGGLVVQDAAEYEGDARELAGTLLYAFTADVVELHAHEPAFVTEPGERPLASGWARRQAGEGDKATNRRHELLPLDELTRHLLRLLDGSRARPELVDALFRRVAEQGLVVQQHGQPVTDPDRLRSVLAEGLEVRLRGLGRSALLVS
ncbi:MAG: class I SAM-dependent methyltransferase [Gemmataceae bacterium]|nr:class I SAM-dependent methyltransferase [Gemmataceae bacterium]